MTCWDSLAALLAKTKVQSHKQAQISSTTSVLRSNLSTNSLKKCRRKDNSPVSNT